MKTDCHLRVKKRVHMLFMSVVGIRVNHLLQRSTAKSQPAGIYRCDIAVSGSGRGTVYIETGGMYITIFSCLLKTEV